MGIGRVALGVASQGSHRSGRAQLGHPVRPAKASLSALLSVSLALTRDRSPSPRRVARSRVPDGQPPSLHGVPAVQVPPPQWYYEAVRLPASFAPHFVSFAWRYQALRLLFRSLAAQDARPRAGGS
jgi:hypothetical protein